MSEPVEAIYQRVAAAWPGVHLEPSRFYAAWARLADTQDSPPLEHAADLYLAAAALENDSVALDTLRRRLVGCLPALRSFQLAEHDAQALVNDTLGALIGTNGAPRLRSYSARGPLDAWLQVVLTRRLLNAQPHRGREVEFDEVLLGEVSTEAAPELELLKERFRGVFSQCFRAALQSLSPKQRNLLRQHYLDQLSLEELGMQYRVHRATVARNLADARASLLEGTRNQVSQALGIGRLEVDSIMRVVASRLDISATFFLSNAVSA